MKSGISKKAVLGFLLAGVIGLLFFVFYYNQAFPEASIDLKLSREEIVARSRAFLLENGFDLTGYQSVAVFDDRRNEIDFLERHLGLKAANDLFRKKVAVWRWKVRWFKVLEEVEYSVELTTDGRLAGFSRTLPEAAAGPRLDLEQARSIAQDYLGRRLGIDVSRYAFVDSAMEDRPHRLDRTFTWKSSDFGDFGGSQYRLSVAVQGDKVGAFSEWLKIPETWTVAQKETGEKRSVFVSASYLPILLFYLGMIVFFFWRVHEHDVRWRSSFRLGGAFALIVLLTQLNKLPFAYLSYDTVESLKAFWMGSLSAPVLAAALSFLFAVPVLAASTSAGRLYLPDRPGSYDIFAGSYLISRDAGRQILVGYGSAFAFLGYVTLFYVFGQRFLGVWSPVEVPFSNEFSTIFPPLTSVYTGVSAAFGEELVFRLFAIAVLSRLIKREWLAVVIPALIWGFAHTSYPQEPIWIRGVELSVAGVVYGWIFLRYGLIATIVSHYLYDVFLGIVPQLQSGRPVLTAGALATLALPLILLFALWLKRRTAASVSLPADEPPAGRASAVASSALNPEPLGPFSALAVVPVRRLVCFMVLAASIYGVSFFVPHWDFYGKAPPVRLTKEEGARLCQKELTALGFDARDFSSFTEFRDGSYGLPDYVISRFGIGPAYERFRGYYGYRPQWITRWYKEKAIVRYEVAVDEQGRLTYLNAHLAEKDPGARLEPDEAKAISDRFLSAVLQKKGESWECIETDTMDRPNRIDYGLTYRDKGFSAAGLQRKIRVRVSGDGISGLAGPLYEVPEEWTRHREVVQKSLRNTAREYAGGFVAVALFVFFIIEFIILLRHRYAAREDLKKAFRWTVLVGIVPSLLLVANTLPSFFHQYYYRTEAALSTYIGSEVLSLVGRFIWVPTVLFFLFLFGSMMVRAWLPERGGLVRLAASVRPKLWGSSGNRWGVFLGLAMAALASGLDTMGRYAKALLSPDLFSPTPVSTDISVNQLSELLNLAEKIPLVVLLSLGMVMVVAVFRRFCKKDGWVLAVLIAVMLLATDDESLSWHILSLEWCIGMAALVIYYGCVTRVLRWNVMAYLTWMWVDLNSDALVDFGRFALSASPEFFWSSLIRMAALVLPIAAVLLYGFIGGRADKGRGVAGDESANGGPGKAATG